MPKARYVPLALQPYGEVLLVREVLQQRITIEQAKKKKMTKQNAQLKSLFFKKDGADSEKQMERK